MKNSSKTFIWFQILSNVVKNAAMIGIFCNFISTTLNKILVLNNLLLIFCQILDIIASSFSKNFKKIYPLGFFLLKNEN